MLTLTKMHPIQELHQFETADEIATFLEDEGIKGIIRGSSSCPLANFFSKRGFDAAVCREHIYISGQNTFANTDALHNFVYNFDNGDYPQLID